MSNRVRRDKDSNRKIWAVVFVFVSVFCIIFFAARGRFNTPVTNQTVLLIMSPFQKSISWVGSQLDYLTSNIWDIVTVHQQNKMLRSEVEQLRAQNLQASEFAAENERLRALVEYKQSALQFDLLAARVIGRDASTWSNMIVINRGTADGVANNMAVVTPKGLVGHIVEAGLYSSKVELILDPRSSVGTLVQRPESRVAGILEGDIDNPTMPKMINVPKNADMVEGDIIVTSGFGGVYPKGLVVGIVSAIKNDAGGLLKYGILETAVDFQKLEDVAVIVNSREAAPQPLTTPQQTPGTETDPKAQQQSADGQQNATAQPQPDAAGAVK